MILKAGGVDCGGNVCTACTEHARNQFAKPVWLTEFAPERDSCGTTDPAELASKITAFVNREIAALESEPYVFRYAWFMPKTDIATLDHVDLLVEDSTTLTPIGELYLGRTCEPDKPPRPNKKGRRKK